MNPDDVPETGPLGFQVHLTREHLMVLGVVQRFGGIPLSCVDVADETGFTPTKALRLLQENHALMLLSCKTGPRGTQLFYTGKAL